MSARPSLSLSERRAGERVRVLTGIFRAVDFHVEQGHPVRAQFLRLARRWRGAFYRCDPTRRLKLSAGNLTNLYYSRWLRSNRDPQALRYRYGANAPRFKLTIAHRRRLPGILREALNLRAVHDALFAKTRRPPSVGRLRKLFAAEEIEFLNRAFAARRQALRDARQFDAWLRHDGRTFATGGKS